MGKQTRSNAPRYLFVTGRLAEFSLREVLDDLAARAGFTAEVAVLPITVAALMTPGGLRAISRSPDGIDRVILPGYCGAISLRSLSVHGDSRRAWPGRPAQPAASLRPRKPSKTPLRPYDIEILAEINHAPGSNTRNCSDKQTSSNLRGQMSSTSGCIPGTTWTQAGDAVAALRDRGIRVSIDSFDPAEIELAVSAGAELVLSVNATNRQHAPDWGVEVVAIPDQPGSLTGLDETIEFLRRYGVPFRVDAILEPIGFGFAARSAAISISGPATRMRR